MVISHCHRRNCRQFFECFSFQCLSRHTQHRFDHQSRQKPFVPSHGINHIMEMSKRENERNYLIMSLLDQIRIRMDEYHSTRSAIDSPSLQVVEKLFACFPHRARVVAILRCLCYCFIQHHVLDGRRQHVNAIL